MIPVFDITRQNKILKKELDQAIQSVIKNGVFILGLKVEEFEKKFAEYIGVKYAVGVASGTDAISLALLSMGIESGDEVIMPANAYPSIFAITQIGAIPKLVDIDFDTYNIDPSKIPAAISRKTKAILPVHMYGQPADMEAILAIGNKYKIPVVEDCAQAAGSEFTGPVPRVSQLRSSIASRDEVNLLHNHRSRLQGEARFGIPRSGHPLIYHKTGSIGDVGCFSFYPTKNLGCFGDGGMVVTDNKEIYERVKLLRMYGEKTRYNSILLGRNSRLDELQAAILSVKLKYLEKWNEKRREIANLYKSHLAGPAAHVSQALGSKSTEKFQREFFSVKAGEPRLGKPSLASPASNKHVYHLFVIRSEKRDELKKFLERKGIGTGIHYPIPIHLVPSMKFLGYKKGDFPESEKACKEILSLPMFPELRDSEVKQVAEAILQYR